MLFRPDGSGRCGWGIKDQNSAHSLPVEFHNSSDRSNHYFAATAKQVSFGADSPNGQNGHAAPDGPAVKSDQPGGKGAEYTLPRASVSVLRGTVQ